MIGLAPAPAVRFSADSSSALALAARPVAGPPSAFYATALVPPSTAGVLAPSVDAAALVVRFGVAIPVFARQAVAGPLDASVATAPALPSTAGAPTPFYPGAVLLAALLTAEPSVGLPSALGALALTVPPVADVLLPTTADDRFPRVETLHDPRPALLTYPRFVEQK